MSQTWNPEQYISVQLWEGFSARRKWLMVSAKNHTGPESDGGKKNSRGLERILCPSPMTHGPMHNARGKLQNITICQFLSGSYQQYVCNLKVRHCVQY
ncbi:hypothetical protein AMELA_G00138390, partial [Ameiurus melas]